MPRLSLRLLTLACLVAASPGGVRAADDEAQIPRFRVYLDPGHGGKPENQGRQGGAHWDPKQGKFLNVYRYGSEWRAKQAEGGHVIAEQALVLELAKQVRDRLQWTQTPAGWKRFEGLLSRYGAVLPPFQRLRFDVAMSREHDYASHPKAGARDINKYFRIFDSPENYPYKAGGAMHPGRLSESAAFSPHLQLSLHIDGSTDKTQRGMSALMVPSPSDFETNRKIALGLAESSALKNPLRRYWSYRGHSRTKLGWALNDTWTYFTGFGSDPEGKTARADSYIGQRWQHVDWAYRDAVEGEARTSLERPFPGAFFEREATPFEEFRRGGGPEEVGGDNLYAGEELLRYIRYAWWQDYAAGGEAWAKGLTPKQLLPSLEKPTAADWAMPLLTNAVAPYLELGQLLNAKDRFLLSTKVSAMADGLAVGIYSLFAGFEVPPVEGVEAPKGHAIEWPRYRLPGGESYFEASHPKRRKRQLAGPPPAATTKTEAGS